MYAYVTSQLWVFESLRSTVVRFNEFDYGINENPLFELDGGFFVVAGALAGLNFEPYSKMSTISGLPSN